MRDIRSLDLNLLKALDALLDERSVTRAAARLGLTQPAVSGMLTRLREGFEDPLLVRAQRGMVPTPRALELAGPLKQMLAEVEELLRPMEFHPATAEFTLTLAASDYALSAILMPFLVELRVQAPNIRVAVRPIADATILGQFERGEVDIALMTLETACPELHARRLFDERHVCVLREGHPALAGWPAEPMTLDVFCSLDHVRVSLDGHFAGVLDQALAALGRTRRVLLSVSNFLILPTVLRSSDLVAVTPGRLVEGQAGLVVLPPPLPVPGFTKLAVWHGRTHRDPARRWVRSLLFDVCERFQLKSQ